MRWAWSSVLFVGVLVGCQSKSPPTVAVTVAEGPTGPEWFVDVSARLGIDTRLQAGSTGTYFMPQVMGSGLGVFDADGDDRLDLLVLNNTDPQGKVTHRFFRQQADGRFRDATVGSGFDFAGYGMGVAAGDIDNDGAVDVYISQYGGGRLLRNRGKGTFENVTASAGVASLLWSTSCCFMDENRDGWLDLVVVNYVDYNPSHACIEGNGKGDYCHPNQFSGTALRFYRNRGCDAKGAWLGFEDRTLAAGFAKARSNGLGVTSVDGNGDGWPDLFVANDAQANHLWINQQDGTFRDEAELRNVAFNSLGNPAANMGIAVGDLRGTGRFDLFVTHLSEEVHTLWHQHQAGLFRDATASSGLANTAWRGTGFGTVALDFNHDGLLDLAVANGRVSRRREKPTHAIPEALPTFWHDYAERNQLFAGEPKGRFRDVSRDTPNFASPAGVYRGLAWGDLDCDGRLELILTQIEGPVRILQSQPPPEHHWLSVQVVDPRWKRDAYGAIVRVVTDAQAWIGQCNPGQSYCSSGDPRVHFGLGQQQRYTAIDVEWPDGSKERFPGGPVDRRVRLLRGEGKKAP